MICKHVYITCILIYNILTYTSRSLHILYYIIYCTYNIYTVHNTRQYCPTLNQPADGQVCSLEDLFSHLGGTLRKDHIHTQYHGFKVLMTLLTLEPRDQTVIPGRGSCPVPHIHLFSVVIKQQQVKEREIQVFISRSTSLIRD